MKAQTTRSLHWLTLVLNLVAGVLIVRLWPELMQGAPATLATVGFFAGMYGLAFTVVELGRTRAATELAAHEAKKVFHTLTRLATVEDVTRCRAHIGVAMDAVRERTPVPAPVLRHIAEIYIKVFRTEALATSNPYRENRNLLESFAFSGLGDERASQKLWNCLASVSGHFAELEADTKRFMEITQ